MPHLTKTKNGVRVHVEEAGIYQIDFERDADKNIIGFDLETIETKQKENEHAEGIREEGLSRPVSKKPADSDSSKEGRKFEPLI